VNGQSGQQAYWTRPDDYVIDVVVAAAIDHLLLLYIN
jgi:hypothetical protein